MSHHFLTSAIQHTHYPGKKRIEAGTQLHFHFKPKNNQLRVDELTVTVVSPNTGPNDRRNIQQHECNATFRNRRGVRCYLLKRGDGKWFLSMDMDHYKHVGERVDNAAPAPADAPVYSLY